MTSGKSNDMTRLLSDRLEENHEQISRPKICTNDKDIDVMKTPETINSPPGLSRNKSNSSSGHHRRPSWIGESPRVSQKTQANIVLETSLTLDDIHARMRVSSPSLPSPRAFFTSPPSSTQTNSNYRSPNDPQERKRHPLLLDSPVGPHASSLPPRSKSTQPSHRRRSSVSRRSSGSLLGFIPLPSPAEEELEEDNAIRASLNMPLAPDLESQERLLEEQKHHDYAPTPPEAVASTWLAMQQNRRRSSSAGNVRCDIQEEYDPKIRSDRVIDNGSNIHQNVMDHRSSYSGILRHPTTRQGSHDSSGRRNQMATIRSYPDEENEGNDKREEEGLATGSIPVETTRLLSDSGRSRALDGDHARRNRRSYT